MLLSGLISAWRLWYPFAFPGGSCDCFPRPRLETDPQRPASGRIRQNHPLRSGDRPVAV